VPADMIGPARSLRWLLPIVAFVAAAMVTAALREDRGDPRPAYAPRDVSGAIAAPRLADVLDLPRPLASRRPPARRSRAAEPAPTASPAPTPTASPAPATTAPAAATPAPPVAAPAPPAPAPTAVPAPQATPAPTFDDSGSGPEFDDDGAGP